MNIAVKTQPPGFDTRRTLLHVLLFSLHTHFLPVSLLLLSNGSTTAQNKFTVHYKVIWDSDTHSTDAYILVASWKHPLKCDPQHALPFSCVGHTKCIKHVKYIYNLLRTPQTCPGTGFIMMAEIQSAISQKRKHTKTGVYWQVILDPPIRDDTGGNEKTNAQYRLNEPFYVSAGE